ncbi:hypothetical protein [Bradyrhizobium huanghuaihaiense]|uniref:hypothetical protein n=1 Tax=Bradyrhizobium huanghuaihaiense TaxID=990078 RepID=UPI0004784992|nr:hypothetical protein [Bradyrhizobium huanghuaihaiense]
MFGYTTDELIRLLSFGFAIVVTLGAAFVFAWALLVTVTQFKYWEELLRLHFAAIIGLPGAAAASFALVVFLRQTEGPIEFEGLGFKFKGASGQVAMWAVCFLTIAAAIKMCW